MNTLELPRLRSLAALAIGLSLSTSAFAQTYTAKAGSSIAGNESGNTGSVAVETFWDGSGTNWTRNAFSRAERGALQADALCATYAKYNVAAYGIAEFEYDDVIFSSAGSAPVQVGLKFTLEGNAAVVNGNSLKVIVREGSQLVGEATMVAGGGVTATYGLTGWSMTSAFGVVRSMTVPVNTPVNLKLYLAVGAAGSSGGHNANGNYTLRLGGVNPIPAPCDQFTVFDLPPGVTVDSVQAGIVDNVWMPAPWATSYCVAAPNSVSAGGAQISASGSSTLSANDLVLSAGPIPVGQVGLFIHGSTQVQLPFGEGFLCTGGQVLRILPPTPADASGFVTLVVDNTGSAGNGLAVGAIRDFQLWYRDPLGGDIDGDGSADGFSLSDATEICFH